ncbi:MAG: YihY/virulence factor BrkB family protein [Myxococcota bacterium]
MVLWQLLRETFREWRDDRANAQGAALAFYALFAAAPLLVVATTVAGFVLGSDGAEAMVASELGKLLTPEITANVVQLVEASSDSTGVVATAAGLMATLWAASRGFFHLQATLNAMWGVRSVREPGVVALVERKLLAFASVALCGILLLASLIATTALYVAARRAPFSFDAIVLRLLEEVWTFGLVTLLLMIVYRTLPDVRIHWGDVVLGSAVSAMLFVFGKHAVAVYLHHVGTHSASGAAGSVAAVLLYVQYMAQVLLFGAKFTSVFARWRGHPIRPGPGAARVVRTTVRDELGVEGPPG